MRIHVQLIRCSIKLSYKYPEFTSFLSVLEKYYYTNLPLIDENNKPFVYIPSFVSLPKNITKHLLSSHYESPLQYEDEIFSTNAIENIDITRESIQNILQGFAPKKDDEEIAYAFNKGLQYIRSHPINKENLYELYQIVIAQTLTEDTKLHANSYYRHDAVYVVGSKVEHVGVSHKKIEQYMDSLFQFIHLDDDIHDLYKAVMIHFYFTYIHPYFDGNGRMARLLHIWYLLQSGYSATLSVPFSQSILSSKKEYYDAFSLVENNYIISHHWDVTPFIQYFSNHVYNNIHTTQIDSHLARINAYLSTQKITEKEHQLWNYIVIHYGKTPFSTKQLEKDYGNAAYATIRSFVMKFETLGLLSTIQYSTKKKYFIQMK